VSREEAHRRAAAGRGRATTRTPEEAGRPQSPLFTARTDQTTGVIRTRGHLDRVGADALCLLVTALQQLGHRQITVQLGATTVADDAEALLAAHARLVRP
jgi:hypothetical protein